MKSVANQGGLIFTLDPHPLAASLADKLGFEQGQSSQRLFPDGESYLRIDTPVQGRHCIVLAELSHPNRKYLPLVFLLQTLRELGATSVGLVAPYLSYMRQDKRFAEGEAITSRIFAQQLSAQIDWLVTVDPHLHRYHSLDEIYATPSRVVAGAPLLAGWLKGQANLLLVGPDAESEQWVSQIAAHSGQPFVIGAKQRFGDRDVRVTLPDLGPYHQHTAVVIDDVIASGQTILKCIAALQTQGVERIKCAAVHGIFVGGVDAQLLAAGLEELATTNTIVHSSNAMDITDLLLTPINECLQDQQKHHVND
ncbi:MAG: ribose-phosphate diphosphokinase [Gammaproteobacteria bacterium]|nr:ribose-phosphate diphosphokinase [Gammaproteobacteria bacterium]MBQ0838974.1 ribose-phosphate diphosphokinase [Gammaproteobacteria bacterium]